MTFSGSPSAPIRRLLLAAGLLAAAGCTTVDPGPRRLTGDPVQDAMPRDRVLVEYREALTALRAGNYDAAKRHLDDAINRIGGLLSGPDDAAARARGLFAREGSKTFIGEPYERAMAYYYRGVLYWRDGEIDNARACFRSAQLTDGEAEGAEHRADFVLLDYLEGLASAKLGADGSDAYARAAAHSRRELPPYDPAANVLLVAEFGRGPGKYAAGEFGEQLRFRTADSRVRSAMLRVGEQEIRFLPWDDLNFQATTRGGRAMDHVLGRKAVFKGGAEAVGDVALIGAVIAAQNIYKPVEKRPSPPGQNPPAPPPARPRGRAESQPPPRGQREEQWLAAEKKAAEERRQKETRTELEKDHDAENLAIALGAVGIFAKVLSAATTPQADTRTWGNLPQYLSAAAIALPPGEHAATLEFFDAGERRVDSLTRQLTVVVPDAGRDTVVFLSEHPR